MPVSENSVEVCKEIGIDISDMHSTAYSDKKLDEYDKFYCMSVSHKFFLMTQCAVPADKIEVINVADRICAALRFTDSAEMKFAVPLRKF